MVHKLIEEVLSFKVVHSTEHCWELTLVYMGKFTLPGRKFMVYPGKVNFPIYPIILPCVTTCKGELSAVFSAMYYLKAGTSLTWDSLFRFTWETDRNPFYYCWKLVLLSYREIFRKACQTKNACIILHKELVSWQRHSVTLICCLILYNSERFHAVLDDWTTPSSNEKYL